MICYKDRTFCSFYKECKNGNDCKAALTEDVVKSATLWWGDKGEPPIMQFSNKPECFEVVK